MFDDLPQFPAAQAEVAALLRDGKLANREVIRDGIEAMPTLFCELFSGSDFGRRLIRIEGTT